MIYSVQMTLKEFREKEFITGGITEVDGNEYYIDKCMGGKYFCGFIGQKQYTRATARMIQTAIIEDVLKK